MIRFPQKLWTAFWDRTGTANTLGGRLLDFIVVPLQPMIGFALALPFIWVLWTVASIIFHGHS